MLQLTNKQIIPYIPQSITLTTPLTPEEEQLLHVLLVSLCLLTSDFTHQYSMSLKLMSACLDGISIGSPAVEVITLYGHLTRDTL